jgi:hypothetical protein
MQGKLRACRPGSSRIAALSDKKPAQPDARPNSNEPGTPASVVRRDTAQQRMPRVEVEPEASCDTAFNTEFSMRGVNATGSAPPKTPVLAARGEDRHRARTAIATPEPPHAAHGGSSASDWLWGNMCCHATAACRCCRSAARPRPPHSHLHHSLAEDIAHILTAGARCNRRRQGGARAQVRGPAAPANCVRSSRERNADIARYYAVRCERRGGAAGRQPGQTWQARQRVRPVRLAGCEALAHQVGAPARHLPGSESTCVRPPPPPAARHR